MQARKLKKKQPNSTHIQNNNKQNKTTTTTLKQNPATTTKPHWRMSFYYKRYIYVGFQLFPSSGAVLHFHISNRAKKEKREKQTGTHLSSHSPSSNRNKVIFPLTFDLHLNWWMTKNCGKRFRVWQMLIRFKWISQSDTRYAKEEQE